VNNRLILPGDHNPKLTTTDQATLRLYPELGRLIDLRDGGGWFFQPVQLEGAVELLAGTRTWPEGWSDALAIRDVGDARAFRCDPAGGEVWQREGGLVEVIDELVELPGPDQPYAPRLVQARAPQLWVPGQ
jgi:hypothetical protein